jgi:WD40 repeat protein
MFNIKEKENLLQPMARRFIKSIVYWLAAFVWCFLVVVGPKVFASERTSQPGRCLGGLRSGNQEQAKIKKNADPSIPREWEPIITELVNLVLNGRTESQSLSNLKDLNLSQSLVIEKRFEVEQKMGREKALILLNEVQSRVRQVLLGDKLTRSTEKRGSTGQESNATVRVNMVRPAMTHVTRGTELVREVSVNSDGQLIVTGCADGYITIGNAKTEGKTLFIRAHKASVDLLLLSPNGEMLLSNAKDEPAILRTVRAPKEVAQLKGVNGVITNATFSKDSKTVWTSSYASSSSQRYSIQKWDALTGKELQHMFFGDSESIYSSVGFSPQGDKLVTGEMEGVVSLWDTLNGKRIRNFIGHESQVQKVVVSPDGRRLVSAANDEQAIRVWDLETGKELFQLDGKNSAVSFSLVFSPDGKMILGSFADKAVRLWDASTGALLYTFDSSEVPSSAAFYPDSKHLLIGVGNEMQTWSIFEEINLGDDLTTEIDP